MKKNIITLTESEIETIQTALCDDSLYYLDRAYYLNEYNNTGANTQLIEKLKEAAHKFTDINSKLDGVKGGSRIR